jgi:hypothetical protein
MHSKAEGLNLKGFLRKLSTALTRNLTDSNRVDTPMELGKLAKWVTQWETPEPHKVLLIS